MWSDNIYRTWNDSGEFRGKPYIPLNCEDFVKEKTVLILRKLRRNYAVLEHWLFRTCINAAAMYTWTLRVTIATFIDILTLSRLFVHVFLDIWWVELLWWTLITCIWTFRTEFHVLTLITFYWDICFDVCMLMYMYKMFMLPNSLVGSRSRFGNVQVLAPK